MPMNIKSAPIDIHERENFCARPFDSLVTMNFGEYKMCCDSMPMGSIEVAKPQDVWNNDTWKSVRKSMLLDQKHPACNTCWNKESKGITSARDKRTQLRPLLNNCNPDGSMQSFPKIVSLRLGNTCNLKCVMCAPFNSTKWYEDQDVYSNFIENNQQYIPLNNVASELLDFDILKQVEHLTFIGGEPFLIKSHIKILDYLIQADQAKNITLKYFSNTTLLPDWCEAYWQKFKRIELRSSIDATAEQYEYIRFPGKWSAVEDTTAKINNLELKNFDYGICFVFMNINALDLETLFKWRNQRHWKIKPPVIRPDYLTEPNILSANHLSDKDKSMVIKSLSTISQSLTMYEEEKTLVEDMRLQLSQGSSNAPEVFNKRNLFLSALDQKRSTNFRKTLTLETMAPEC